ncbi:MAG: amidohydrolase family protein [Coriobacteriales bacterium]|jgi:5-methylthioadenosine/S-adenosylhomocysteine deaminase|nr:amidohydrolase family protein [Coriobacteriales bacterium]
MLLVARYVLPVSGPHIENGAVLVRQGRIEDIGYATKLKIRYPEEETRDFGLSALMPGFVDTHTHLESSAMRGLILDVPYAAWKLHIVEKEGLFTPQDWEDSAYLGTLEAVKSGITTVADITATGASRFAVQNVGLRGVIYREVGTMERKEVDHVLDDAFAQIADWRSSAESDRLQIGIAPSALHACHPLVFQKTAEYAADGTPLAIHLAGSKEEYEFIRYGSSPFSVHSIEQERGYGIDMPPWLATGVSPVRYILNWGVLSAPNVLAIHCVHVDDADIDVLAEHDVAVAVCSRCNAQLAMGVAPLPKFIKAGLRIGLGTDSPAATSNIDPIAEMRIGLLLHRALGTRAEFLTAAQMVRYATLGAAQALHIDDQVGSLEVGKQADIIAIDLSNSNQAPTHDPNSAIVHTATQDNIILNMVGGTILYDGNQHRHSIDLERVLARSEEMRLKLRR